MLVDQFPDRIVQIDGEDYLYFGGTNYLGMATNSEFQELVFSNLKKWGTSYGSSRKASVQLQVYDKVEKHLARFVGAQDCVTISSGMLAGKLVIEELLITTDVFYSFPNTHAALFVANCNPFFIDGKLNPKLETSNQENITILLDGVPSIQTQPIDLSVLDLISDSKIITLVVDESHSFGIMGNQGHGIFASIKNANVKQKIMIASLGKAFGLSGGIIASNFGFCGQIKTLNSFVAAAGMNPAFAQTMLDSASIFVNQLKKLNQNLEFIAEKLVENENLDFTKNYPIIRIKSEEINADLLKNKIIITHFKYSANNYLNRIIITANHTIEDLEKLVGVLNKK